MESFPSTGTSKFVELLSQQTLSFGNYEDSVELSLSQVPFRDSSTSEATASKRTPGVKAAKTSGKKTVVETVDLNKFQSMWTIKQQELAVKERLSKMSLLDSLIGKKGTVKGHESLRRRVHKRDSSISEATASKRPPGVKAAKATGKKTVVETVDLNKFQSMWTIKQQDLAVKERLSKMSLLDSLIGKKEPLAEHEEILKSKLINDLLSSEFTREVMRVRGRDTAERSQERL
ncbi:hypothetical protein DY000_02059533 [Brassica cretica]|uniref:Uncharacterized protein n=1 Tax=Brassica cretica TaxID=69181 RepID=A0ABQ7AMW9_BRACR|nr:hypothetical protein DY000_02059533 [Brassica cretica]